MALWFVLALMTAAAVFAVLWPLGRRLPQAGGSDIAVYRDQIDEIARDLSAGLIGEREAEAARVEVSRRLIAAADGVSLEPAPGGDWRRRAVALSALVLLPLGAVGLYAAIGSPGLPERPIAGRLDALPDKQSLPELVARVEAHLERNPQDGRGWEVLAPVYMQLRRYEDGARARGNAVRLLGATATREADWGEALAAAAQGVVTADAKAAFERALKLDEANLKARYFLGLAAEQDGRLEEAATIWRALLVEAPQEAPWRVAVQQSLARVEPGRPQAQAPSGAGTSAGPTAADVADAAKLSPEEQQAMVRGMVESLATRLKEDGGDLDGWLRLIRAYMVLNERDKAMSAIAQARRAMTGDSEKLQKIETLVRGLGLEG